MNPEAHGHNTQRTSGSSEICRSRFQGCCLLGYDDMWSDIRTFRRNVQFLSSYNVCVSDDGDSGFFLKKRLPNSTTKWGASFPKAEVFLMTETYNSQ